MDKILDTVASIIRDELDNETLDILPTTVASDIEEWDSLANIQIIVALERHYKIKFTASEIQGFSNVEELCKTIATKTAN